MRTRISELAPSDRCHLTVGVTEGGRPDSGRPVSRKDDSRPSAPAASSPAVEALPVTSASGAGTRETSETRGRRRKGHVTINLIPPVTLSTVKPDISAGYNQMNGFTPGRGGSTTDRGRLRKMAFSITITIILSSFR